MDVCAVYVGMVVCIYWLYSYLCVCVDVIVMSSV